MAIVKPNTILEPFATNGDFVVPPVIASTTLANQDTGFPPLQSTKYSLGGLFVKRDEMNGVINLYSQFCFWQQCGGTYTFDQTVSDEYGGYPAGIVLFCASNNSWQVSLVNSNTFNFVTTPSYINDGTHWSQIGGSHGQMLFDTPGSHSFKIPAGINKLNITASGGGGGGAAGNSQLTYCMSGGGGSSGEFIFKKEYTVTPLNTLSIMVGSSGAGGATNGQGGTTGGTTIITGIVSLSGGFPGGNGTFIAEAYRNGIITGGLHDSIGGGTGNTIISSTFTGALSGGNGGSSVFGGGGNGGGGNGTPGDALNATNGKLGGGGGGGGAQNNSSGTDFSHGANGGDGFVLIEW